MKKLMKFKKTNTLLESENEKWKVGEEMSEICVVFAEHIPDACCSKNCDASGHASP